MEDEHIVDLSLDLPRSLPHGTKSTIPASHEVMSLATEVSSEASVSNMSLSGGSVLLLKCEGRVLSLFNFGSTYMDRSMVEVTSGAGAKTVDRGPEDAAGG